MLSKIKSIQTCALCGKTGHNKRKCRENKKSDFVIKKQSLTPNFLTNCQNANLNDNDFGYIQVSTRHDIKSSPHIVNLNKKLAEDWNKVEVYQENNCVLPKQRVAVDFASLVREANFTKSKKNENPVILENQKEEQIFENVISVDESPKALDSILDLKDNLDDVRNNFEVDNIRPIENLFETEIKNKKIKNKKSFFQFFYGIMARPINISFGFKARKFIFVLAIFLAILVLPFPAIGYYHSLRSNTQKVIEKSTQAFLSLQSSTVAAFNSNISQARFDLNEALVAFGDAESIIDKEFGALVFVAKLLPVVGEKVYSRQNLLLAGHNLALGNTYLVKGIDEAVNQKDLDTMSRLEILRNHLKSAIPQYQNALKDLVKVENQTLPSEYQESFVDFKILFSTFVADLNNMVDVMDLVQSVMGKDEFKRYLIVFQNNNELRASGGFLGSFAVIDVQKGKIMNIDLPCGGSYDLQGQLDVFVKPPLPLQVVNARWEFQDSNWFPDFPSSAKKMAWFYEHSRNSTVDGVIAINASVLERMLKVIGPIYNEEFDLLISSDDVLDKIQNEVEIDYDKEKNKPKAVLAGLLDQLLKSLSLLKPEDLIRLVTELNGALDSKEIQIYFSSENEEKKVKDFGWSGEISQVSDNQDFLMVVNSNLGGGKSDKSIEQEVEHQVVVDVDGSITDTVFIRRMHSGKAEDKFYGHPNVNYIRVYVPDGAELLDAGGFSFPSEDSFTSPPDWYNNDKDLNFLVEEKSIHPGTGTRITKEFGKTVFGNWIFTPPNENSEVFFTYSLPFKIISSDFNRQLVLSKNNNDLSHYSLLWQKQSGIESLIKSAIIYPDGWKPIWKAKDNMQAISNGATMQGRLTADEIIGLAMKKQ